jgi:dipeptidyl aminopeptidase/acylaminoacyl peptidase
MKAKSKRIILSLVCTIIVCGSLRAGASGIVVAALKGAEVILVDGASGSATRLTGDPRSKGALRWLPDGQRISYLVSGEKGIQQFAKFVMPSWPKLVISDLTGHVTREVSLRTDAKITSLTGSDLNH